MADTGRACRPPAAPARPPADAGLTARDLPSPAPAGALPPRIDQAGSALEGLLPLPQAAGGMGRLTEQLLLRGRAPVAALLSEALWGPAGPWVPPGMVLPVLAWQLLVRGLPAAALTMRAS